MNFFLKKRVILTQFFYAFPIWRHEKAFERSINEQAAKLLISIDFINDPVRNKIASIVEFCFQKLSIVLKLLR